eukprot:gene4401-6225_t
MNSNQSREQIKIFSDSSSIFPYESLVDNFSNINLTVNVNSIYDGKSLDSPPTSNEAPSRKSSMLSIHSHISGGSTRSTCDSLLYDNNNSSHNTFERVRGDSDLSGNYHFPNKLELKSDRSRDGSLSLDDAENLQAFSPISMNQPLFVDSIVNNRSNESVKYQTIYPSSPTTRNLTIQNLERSSKVSAAVKIFQSNNSYKSTYVPMPPQANDNVRQSQTIDSLTRAPSYPINYPQLHRTSFSNNKKDVAPLLPMPPAPNQLVYYPQQLLGQNNTIESNKSFAGFEKPFVEVKSSLHHRSIPPSENVTFDGAYQIPSRPCSISQNDQRLVYKVQFKTSIRYFLLGPQANPKINTGNFVIVQADRGEDLGVVTDLLSMHQFVYIKYESSISANDERFVVDLIVRVATMYESQELPKKYHDEMKVTKYCADLCRNAYNLPMVVVDCEFQFDRHKLVIYYDANQRIDFRELVRDLYTTFKTRIWMKKITSIINFQPDPYATNALQTGVFPVVNHDNAFHKSENNNQIGMGYRF